VVVKKIRTQQGGDHFPSHVPAISGNGRRLLGAAGP
jgi:hypothetical protein